MTSVELPTPLVSANWLYSNIEAASLIVLDAELQAVGVTESRQEQYLPGAKVMDLHCHFSCRDSSLPHTMPSREQFEVEIRKLGVNNDSQIVIYDRRGVYSSPRAWWMLKAMGHCQVSVLDGGLPAWVDAGYPVHNTPAPVSHEGRFSANPVSYMFCKADHVADELNDLSAAVLDARTLERFSGQAPEPRSGLRSGHMPGAFNLPFKSVQSNGYLLSETELVHAFRATAGNRSRLVLTCGSGVTACILALAATLAGYRRVSVYDGSWSEWGQLSERPVVS